MPAPPAWGKMRGMYEDYNPDDLQVRVAEMLVATAD